MIRADGLCKRYGARIVLVDTSFTLEDGALVVLGGPSGSGKSTLLRILAGLDLPDRGRVFVGDALASNGGVRIPPHLRSIGFAFQSLALWPHMTVAANIRFGLSKGRYAERQARVDEVLQMIGIADLARRYPSEISFGQARRVALARALAPRPRHLFLDEPLTNLDAETRSSLLSLLKRLNRDEGTAMLFVTHEAEDIRRLGGAHWRLENGTLASVADRQTP